MTDHFKPLWGRNVPKFGIAHAMALGVSAFFNFFFPGVSGVASNVLSKHILNKAFFKGDLIVLAYYFLAYFTHILQILYSSISLSRMEY